MIDMSFGFSPFSSSLSCPSFSPLLFFFFFLVFSLQWDTFHRNSLCEHCVNTYFHGKGLKSYKWMSNSIFLRQYADLEALSHRFNILWALPFFNLSSLWRKKTLELELRHIKELKTPTQHSWQSRILGWESGPLYPECQCPFQKNIKEPTADVISEDTSSTCSKSAKCNVITPPLCVASW